MENKPAGNDELRASLKCPAVFVNKYTVFTGALIRMAFFEQHGPIGGDVPRTAIIMTREDAKSFVRLITRLLIEPNKN